MKKKLNKFNQEDIDTAIKSFDDAYAKLTLIYKYILEFSSNKNIEFQKALEKNINQWVEEIEHSKAYSVLIEIFGIGYENSETDCQQSSSGNLRQQTNDKLCAGSQHRGHAGLCSHLECQHAAAGRDTGIHARSKRTAHRGLRRPSLSAQENGELY